MRISNQYQHYLGKSSVIIRDGSIIREPTKVALLEMQLIGLSFKSRKKRKVLLSLKANIICSNSPKNE